MLIFESMDDAVRIARDVLSGSVDPYLGCGLIASIETKLNNPPVLQIFGLLDHEISGHEHVGFTKTSLLPGILEACRVLTASNL